MKSNPILRFALLAFVLASAHALHAADDGVKKAGQQLERHYYESAAATLRATAASGDMGPLAVLTLARAYSQNAQLHRLLQNASLGIGNLYLQKLAAQTGRERSLAVALYYGEYLTEAGKLREGSVQLKRFADQKDSAANYREIAQVLLSVARKTTAPAARASDPLVRTQLAAAMSLTPASRAAAAAQMDQAIAELLKLNPLLPTRAITNALGVYARNAQFDKAFALLAAADLGRPSFEETINQTKVLRFYDPALLGNLAGLYQAEAERLLLRVKGDSRFKSVAAYFLVDFYLNNEQYDKAAALLPEVLAAILDLPAPYRNRVALMQAAADVRTGQAARGNAALAELGAKFDQDPQLLGEVLLTCVRTKASCPGVIAGARALAQGNQGERFRSLHYAVGEQYATEGRNDLALLSMETARDKSNKNRIDTNDPVLLVRLADLYFKGKSFSESLEIYFELSKEFPAVRQLQETGQGVYSTEYRSAGDVKIF